MIYYDDILSFYIVKHEEWNTIKKNDDVLKMIYDIGQLIYINK